MNSPQNKKLLWYVQPGTIGLQALLQRELPFIEITTVSDLTEACARVDLSLPEFSLIISDSLEFYRSLQLMGFRNQFLYLSSEKRSREVDALCLLNNFTFLPKVAADASETIHKVEELIYKDVRNIEKMSAKIRVVRNSLGMSASEFGQFVGVETPKILAFENDEVEIPMSFIAILSQRLGLGLSFFTYTSNENFLKYVYSTEFSEAFKKSV